MTEREYIIVGDLKSARIAVEVLQDIIPANNECVPASELATVLRMIDKWITAMFEQTRCSDCD